MPMHEDKTKGMTAEQERAFLLKIVEGGPELIRLDENARAEFKQFTSKLESELEETSRKLANILSSEQTGQIESVTAAQLIQEHTLTSGRKTAELRERFRRRSIEVAKFNDEYTVVKWAMKRLKELDRK